MPPVYVVQLDLYEVPFQFVVAGEQVVKDFDVSMIGESEVADASDFALFQQEVQHAVVQIAGTEGFHAAHADAVQQEVVDVVHLQVAEGAVIHGKGLFAAVRAGTEVGQLCGKEEFLPWVAFQGNARGALRQTLHIGGGGVEIVHSVGNGIVYQVVHGFLVYFVSIPVGAFPGGPSHASVSQQGNPVARVGIGTVGHLVGWYLAQRGRFALPVVLVARTAVQGCCRGKRSCTGEFEEIAAVYLVLIVFFHCDRTEIINGY